MRTLETLFVPVCHKANPDEKGTESSGAVVYHFCPTGHKANPDEKGTERDIDRPDDSACRNGHKANPDEKGTER